MKHLGSIVIAMAVAVGMSGGALVADQAPAAGGRKLIAPVRGEARVETTKPVTKRNGNEIVTTIRVRNAANGPIAGLKIEENWYDKGGTPVGGDVYRHPRPLPAAAVIDVELKSPYKASMFSNRYQFTHANGTIKATTVPKLDIPKPATE